MINRMKTPGSDSPVRVRFAPSPTGDLHVGGVRTALFNWLHARHANGKFLVRIEDTDRERSTKDAIQVILDGLAWLGLEPDEEIVFQSSRKTQHREAALKLLEQGFAYRCFCDPRDSFKSREDIDRQGKPFKHYRKCLDLSESEVQNLVSSGKPYAVRLKVPSKTITFHDVVHGEISVDGDEIEDFVLLRSDGSPTYMLAVVVDDADMGITHITRGDDHLSNTPKQILLYKGLGLPIPQFAHVPLILGPDKKRLSKRHGATSITSYRVEGFLQETLINYLGLLGWSPGDDRNIISRQELIDLFDIKGINPHGAVFDEAKLRWLNGIYIGKTGFEEIEPVIERFAQDAVRSGAISDVIDKQTLANSWNLVHTRIHTLRELFTDTLYLFRDPIEYDKKGVRKHFKQDGSAERLLKLKEGFEKLDEFNASTAEEYLRRCSEEWEISAGKLIHPIRLAVSGITGGPGLFEMLEYLGRETVTRRLGLAVDAIESGHIFEAV